MGEKSRIIPMDCDTMHWIYGDTPNDINEKMVELRSELITLNNLYQQAKDEGLTKAWAAVQVFTPEKLEAVEKVNRRICVLRRKSFQNCWSRAMDLVLKFAQERLHQVFPDRDTSHNAMFVYKHHRSELYEKLHRFVSPQFVSQIFLRWKAFDVMLDEEENRWCFVITDPYAHISNIMDEFTERKPYELTRCLEFAFRKLLGDYSNPKDEPLCYNKHCTWLVEGGGRSPVTREDIFRAFKSCTEI